MRQRVAIARTLILSPRIILMDEPFGALDPTTRLHMQELLVDLWREAQATVFFVTHSIEEAVYLGDRVYVFSSAPGTILREMAVPPPDRAAEGDAARAGVRRALLRDPRHHRQARGLDAGGGRLSVEPRARRRRCRRAAAAGAAWRTTCKEAFLFRWNLLFFLGGAAAAALTPLAPVLLPLVAPASSTYLAGLVSIPRFRAAIDAKVHAAGTASGADAGRGAAAGRRSSSMLGGLPADGAHALRAAARALPRDARHRRRRARRGRRAARQPPRRSGRRGSIGCCGCSCGCCCRRRRSIAFCRR